ncbi:MAG: hypothetical protein KA450_00700 [Bacteroidia bacterium]|nr:hypothetical protein [Bacteroidia bacterium]
MKLLHFLSLIILFLPLTTVACDCVAKKDLTIVECRRFDVILTGVVDSVAMCNKGKAITFLQVSEVYKGDIANRFHFDYDCESSCQMSFAKGEQWLIYAIYNPELKVYEVNFCDRNRKSFQKNTDDYYTASLGVNWKDEIDFLKKNIGLKPNATQSESSNSKDITQRENQLGTGKNNLVLLLISALLFLLIYFFVSKKIK